MLERCSLSKTRSVYLNHLLVSVHCDQSFWVLTLRSAYLHRHSPYLVRSHAPYNAKHDLRPFELHDADDTQAHEVPLPAHRPTRSTAVKLWPRKSWKASVLECDISRTRLAKGVRQSWCRGRSFRALDIAEP